MSESRAWPELSEELSRKATNVLHDSVYRYSQHEMTGAELKAATDAMYNTISGLVDRSVLDMIIKVQKVLKL